MKNLLIKNNDKSFKKATNYTTKLPKIELAKKQVTISNSINFKGIGLHSGNKVKMSIHPAEANTGYIFKFAGKNKKKSVIVGNYKNVVSTKLCTTISNSNNDKISTTEHILSALYAMNIDNAVIELDNNEVPIMDGSSKEFVESIKENKIEELALFKKYIKIKRKVEYKYANKTIRVSPYSGTLITCEIGFNTKAIGKQTISFVLNSDIYSNEISSARTFGFLDDISFLRKNGLALGGSLDNAIVIDKDRVLNKSGLRYSDEFVRHKSLDLLGDIALAQHKILGSFFSYHSGHSLNNKLLHKIFASKNNWEFVDSNLNSIF